MSKNQPDTTDNTPQDETIEQYSETFDGTSDLLAQYSDQLHGLPDPFVFYIQTVVLNDENINSDEAVEGYYRAHRQWKNHMASYDRHLAAPSPEHVRSFIRSQRDTYGNAPRTILQRVGRLSKAYRHLQERDVFPHPEGWNPFEIGLETIEIGEAPDKEHHDLSLNDVRRKFASIDGIQRRAIVGMQLKHGSRAGEMCNVKIEDIHLSSQYLQEQYPKLGTNSALSDFTDVIYIPHDREGNKSVNPRLLPIDEEVQWLLTRYMLIRANVEEPWLFLSDRTFTQMTPSAIADEWRAVFRPEYDETEQYKGISSHFGRHWFSSYFKIDVGMEREKVQYMRGDRIGPAGQFPETIDQYLHPKYRHIRNDYRNSVFKLDLPMGYGLE